MAHSHLMMANADSLPVIVTFNGNVLTNGTIGITKLTGFFFYVMPTILSLNSLRRLHYVCMPFICDISSLVIMSRDYNYNVPQ